METQVQSSADSAVKGLGHGQLYRLLLVLLFILAVTDGLVTRYVLDRGLGSESNPFLAGLVQGDQFMMLKIAGTGLAVLLLAHLYQRAPRILFGLANALVAGYTLIVWWNTLVVILSVSR